MTPTLHHLPVISAQESAARGYVSLTTDISATTEASILAGVAEGRNPTRAAFVSTGASTYQLFVRSSDVSHLADEGEQRRSIRTDLH